ncbi:MAG: DUF6265 family protein [Gemmatimonadota bacterium]|nr:DUF6265 family protein [Gemmatimonadota bacterium]
MRPRMTLLSAAVLGTALLAGPASAQSGDTFSEVHFMVGCWAQSAPEGSGLREFYPPPAANMLTGLSQFWRDGRIVDFEFHRIDRSPEGPVLTPHPRGVASVSFRPVDIRADRVVWENLDHDFPQRIMYHLVAADTLVARVEGGEGPDARSIEWRMARTACPM